MSTKLGIAIVLGAILGLFPAAAHAQRPETFASPGELLEILRTGKGRDRARLDKELHMRFAANQTCRAKTWQGYVEPGRIGVVIDADCETGRSLVVLGRIKSGRWRYEGSATLWDMEGLKILVEPMVDPPVDDIIVHNNQVTGGTDIWQGDLMIFRVVHNRLRKVLDTVEYSHFRQWTEPFHWVDQQSRFVIVPATQKQPAEVDETMKLTSNSGGVELKRSFQWSQRTETFNVSMWHSARVTAKRAAH